MELFFKEGGGGAAGTSHPHGESEPPVFPQAEHGASAGGTGEGLHGLSGGFAAQQRAHGFGVEGAGKFAVAFDPRHDGFFIVSCPCHFHGFTFKPSLAAAFRWRSSKLKNTFASKTSAATTCNKSKLRVPSVGV